MSDRENPVIAAPEPKAHPPLTNQDWWPDQVDVSKLHAQSPQANPLGDNGPVARSVADVSYETLVLRFANTGVNGHVQLGNGIAQQPAPQVAVAPAPVKAEVKAATPPVDTSGQPTSWSAVGASSRPSAAPPRRAPSTPA